MRSIVTGLHDRQDERLTGQPPSQSVDWPFLSPGYTKLLIVVKGFFTHWSVQTAQDIRSKKIVIRSKKKCYPLERLGQPVRKKCHPLQNPQHPLASSTNQASQGYPWAIFVSNSSSPEPLVKQNWKNLGISRLFLEIFQKIILEISRTLQFSILENFRKFWDVNETC